MISFRDNDKLATSEEDSDEEIGPFCQFVTRKAQAQLKFVAFDSGLKYKGALQSPREFLTDSSGVSLVAY